MYGGKLVCLNTFNKVTIRDLLPEEYVYVLYNEGVSKTLTYAETNVQAIDGNFDYIDVVPCKHNDFDVDYKCVYCNKTLTTNEAIQILLDELQIAKQELQDAIDNKANATTINVKISSLEKAIDDLNAASKTYVDDADSALKKELTDLINSTKEDVLNTESKNLENAKKELNETIDKKVDNDTFNEKSQELSNAISNLETACKNIQIIMTLF